MVKWDYFIGNSLILPRLFLETKQDDIVCKNFYGIERKDRIDQQIEAMKFFNMRVDHWASSLVLWGKSTRFLFYAMYNESENYEKKCFTEKDIPLEETLQKA